MASPVEICNLALTAMGQGLITTIETPTTEIEELCKLWYPQSRRALLESANWTFAKRRVIMDTPDAVPPEWGYTFKHAIPSDVLRMVLVNNNTFVNTASTFQWRVEDGFIVCDSDTVYVTYIYDREDTTGYSNEFIAALVARLKMDMVIAVTENPKLHQVFSILYETALADAKVSDGLQGKSEQIHASQLVRARQGAPFQGGGF